MTMFVLGDVLSGAEVRVLRDEAARLEFEDGARTAGARARRVKANDQAARSPERDALLEMARKALTAHPVFQSAARPRQMTPLILSRYREGQTYGYHVDDALMGGIRTDLSFTLFLADPESYDGGALEIDDPAGLREVRLPAGSAVLYPSTSLHRVAPVTRGERLAVVGWIESWIRDDAERAILFGIDQALATLDGGGDVALVSDKLAQIRSNLLRRWAGR